MKVGIDRHVVAKALGCGEEGFQFDLLDGSLVCLAALSFTYRRENLVVAEWGEPLRDLRLLLQKREVCGVVDDLEIVPKLSNGRLHRASAVRQRQHAYHLGEIRVGCRADQQAAR